MKKSEKATALANRIREACLKKISEKKLSVKELEGLLGITPRGALKLFSSNEWTLDYAYTVADHLGVSGGNVLQSSKETMKNASKFADVPMVRVERPNQPVIEPRRTKQNIRKTKTYR
jgi:hypothetical protein